MVTDQASFASLIRTLQHFPSGYYQVQTSNPATNPYSFWYQELDFFARTYTPLLRYQANAQNYDNHNTNGLLGGWTFNNLAYVKNIADTSGLGQSAQNQVPGMHGEFSAQGLYTANPVLGPPDLQTTLAPAAGDVTVFTVFKDETKGGFPAYERLWDKGIAGGNGIGVERNGSAANQWCGTAGSRWVCGSFPDNQWNLLVYVRKAGVITLYNSNSLVGTTSVTPYVGPQTCSAATTDTSNFWIASASVANKEIVGEVALFSVYNRALSAQELNTEINAIISEENGRGITLP